MGSRISTVLPILAMSECRFPRLPHDDYVEDATESQRSDTMRFLCLVYFEPNTLAKLSPSEKAALDRNSLAYNEELRKKNQYIAAEALEPVGKACTVRVRRGKMSITDGPFAETKEVVAGFILVEAVGMDEALEIASGIPLAKLGSVEVRPVMRIGG
jgi:hypothetical protein